jgi:hypothetical protein
MDINVAITRSISVFENFKRVLYLGADVVLII